MLGIKVRLMLCRYDRHNGASIIDDIILIGRKMEMAHPAIGTILMKMGVGRRTYLVLMPFENMKKLHGDR